MTSPAPEVDLPYLHIDDLTVHIPATTDIAQLRKQLARAAATGKAAVVPVVDGAGGTVEALVLPARARLVAVSRAAVLVPRKSQPSST